MMVLTRRLCLTTSQTVAAYDTFRTILIKLHLVRVSRQANNVLYYCDTVQLLNDKILYRSRSKTTFVKMLNLLIYVHRHGSNNIIVVMTFIP